MKKNAKKRDQEQEGKSRRLTLSRETIKVLNDPALFGVVVGGFSSASHYTTTIAPCAG